MAKKRIYEVAKELDIENKIVVKKAQDLGFDVKSHMSSLDDKQVSKLVDSLKSTNTTPSTEIFLSRISFSIFLEASPINKYLVSK